MSEQITNPFDPFFEKIREIVREEIKAALAKREPEKLLYTTKEAASILNVEESWLAVKARAGLVPFRMLGHYRYFSMADIEMIISQSAVDNGGVPLVQVGHDGQRVSADSETPRVKSIQTRGGAGDNGN
jgi:hypothetical protein